MDQLFTDPSDEQQIRRQLARYIGGRTTLPEAAWKVVVGQGHVQNFLQGRITWDELAEYARALMLYGDLVDQVEALPERGDASGDEGAEVEAPQFGVYEDERPKAFAEYLELRVAGDPGVLQWRKACWKSLKPLAPEEAYRLARSKDSALHASEGVRHPHDDSGELTSDERTPKGALELFADEAGRIVKLPYLEGSLAEGLHDLSERLRNDLFPYWSVAEASWPVLTGRLREAPACLVGEVESLSNEHLTRKVVNLSVEPWMSADAVLRTYQYLQALTLGRRPRPVSERNLAMVKFAMRQLRAMVTAPEEDGSGPTRVSWRRLMSLWNRQHDQSWAYEDERRFYRDCNRTLRSIVRPYDAPAPTDNEVSTSLKIRIPDDAPSYPWFLVRRT